MAKCELRKRIEKKIAAAHNDQDAALAVCLMLEDELGLAGNGWFDGDEEILEAIGAE
jgi:hypothetical protein